MAPMKSVKRQRASTDAESLYNIEPATSSRHDSRKRARLSAVTDNEDTEASFQDFPGTDDNESDQGHSVDQGEGMEEEEDVDEDDDAQFQATQNHYRQKWDEIREKNPQNMPADDGIIEEVKCINFMCHDKLTVSMGPLINFIIGHNGSGKSAVLTALTLCLGGKAAATNRGQSLKNFIKEGRDHAMLSVRIKNQGIGAFMPEMYGRSIIVERHFSRAGASGFKIKNAKDKTISTKKGDLDDIIDHFAFSLDNPMNVLTQDMARQFLNQSTPADKYKFFIKGTQLETLDQDYQMTTEILNKLESRLEAVQEKCDTLKRQYSEAEKKMRMSDRLETLRDKLRSYQRQMAWVQVEEQEQHLQIINNKISEAEIKTRRLEAEAEAASEAFGLADSSHVNKQKELEDLKGSMEPYETRERELKDEFQKNKTELIDLQSQQRNIKGQIGQAKKDIDRFSREIEKERQLQENANGDAHSQKLAELQEAKETAQAAKSTYDTHVHSFRELNSERDVADRAAKEMAPSLQAKRDDLKNHERLIRELTQDQSQWRLAYDSKLPNLLKAIEQEKGFRSPPVGPLGRHVQLLEPKWSSILERTFGGTLNAFVVTNKFDQTLLSDLMKRSNCTFQILIGDPEPIDTSRNEPASSLSTIMRVLKINNDLVRNQLIINQAIEQSVLFDKREDANQFMFPPGGGRPENVKQCLSINPNKPGAGYRMNYSNGGGEQVTPVHPWPGRPRMQTDSTSRLNLERENHRHYQQEIAEAESNLAQLKKNLHDCNDAIIRHKRVAKELQIQSQRAEEAVERIQDELEANTPQAGKLSALELQLKDAKENCQIQEDAFMDSLDAKEKLNETQREIKAQLDEAQGEIAEVKARIQKTDTKFRDADHSRTRALREKNLAMEKLQNIQSDKVELDNARTEQVERVDEYINQASKISARVDVDRGETLASLEAKWDKLNRDLERNEHQLGGSREQLVSAALEAKARWEKERLNAKVFEDLGQALKSSILNRRDRWRLFRHHITALARIHFAYLLSQRKFRGELLIDPKAKLLDIQVEPDITKSSAKGRQAKTLSGGEKSFSTICLLLAIWDAMGSPIRCLDEFDVFMDNVNRSISMKMMIEAARSSVSRQFILITPQAMGNVAIGDDVKIIRMADPERGQTTLPFER